MKIYLKPGKVQSVYRKHPWIFSGALQNRPDGIKDGDIVQLYDAQNNFLGSGIYSDSGSIAVRMLTFDKENIDQAFWTKRIQQAFDYRQRLHINNEQTNVYRLIHAEGDGLPGLIIDVYKDVAVIQAHTSGMHQQIDFICEALKEVLKNNLSAIYDKSAESIHHQDYTSSNQLLYGEVNEPLIVTENGYQFLVDFREGQKTGFFIDQRENRKLLANYAKGKKVLNAFSYTGSFSVYALAAGAREVSSVDASVKAIEDCEANVKLNFGPTELHNSQVSDVLEFLKDKKDVFDLIILDPPAFAKHIRTKHKAVIGYKRLNIAALKAIKPGGIIFTFSCSQVIDKQLFYNTISAAAIEAQRPVRVLHQLHQPADHPINIYHREGEYLKGLVLYVE